MVCLRCICYFIDFYCVVLLDCDFGVISGVITLKIEMHICFITCLVIIVLFLEVGGFILLA